MNKNFSINTSLLEWLARSKGFLDTGSILQDLKYSYENICNSKKGRKIKTWAKKNGKKCVDGSICNNVEFKDLRDSDIAFGHIISQNWSKSFTYLLNKVNHPDNLYLSCKKCNSSLSDNFPNKGLKNKIYLEGTIGDWLRSSREEIEKT